MQAFPSSQVFKFHNLSSQYGFKLFALEFDIQGASANIFSEQVMGEFEGILSFLEDAGKAGEIDALALISGKPKIFIAGADINLIASAKNASEAEGLSSKGQKLLNWWEDLPFPRVSCINGACMGGGTELSLASSAILMSNDPKVKIGLPEVKLGILPGMGGCVRLPTKIGLAGALPMILAGKTLDGQRAYRSGLAEACLPIEDFHGNCYRWIKKNLKDLKAGKRLARTPKLGGMGGTAGDALEGTALGRSVILNKAKKDTLKQTKGFYPSPIESIEIIRDIGTKYGAKFRGKERDRAMAREAKGFGKVADTDVSRNLIRLFFMLEDVKKENGTTPRRDVSVPKVNGSAVLGAGVMGGGIAQLFADKNMPIHMKDVHVEGLTTGIKAANDLFKKKLKRRRIKKREYLQKLSLISPALDYKGFANTDVVIEAIVENMDIKKKVLADLENHVKDDCVIATNTSSLSVTEMQTAMSKKSRFVGMHFFNPVHKMPLVEVIRGSESSDEAVVTIFELSKRLGKTPIVVRDGAGFLVNRLLVPYLNESIHLMVDGAPIPEIDRALLKFGMPMGPIELIDEVGVDVGVKVLKVLNEAFGERMAYAEVINKVPETERLGKKNGKGLYVYEGREKNHDPTIYSLIGAEPKAGKFSPEDMVERCIYPMINEAARCLDDKIVETPAAVDLGMIMGTGFPPFRGGLMRFADTAGLRKIVDGLKKHEQTLGARFTPSPRLLDMAEKNQTFYG